MSSPSGLLVPIDLFDRLLFSPDEIDCRTIPKISCSPNTCLSQDCFPTLFRTPRGYRDGYIIGESRFKYDVLFLHDEWGFPTYDMSTVKQSTVVDSQTLHPNGLLIYISKESGVVGYITIGKRLQDQIKLGTGFVGYHKGNKRNQIPFPIYSPLSLHDQQHQFTLQYACELIAQAIDEDLPVSVLEQILWLINTVLMIDGHPRLSLEVFKEVLSNFIYDYTSFPEGNSLSQPMNSILGVLQIDGIWSKISPCISFI